jgi:hypothetical protein
MPRPVEQSTVQERSRAPRWYRRVSLSVAAGLVALGAVQAPAFAATDPYSTYSSGGFDVSYPQCSVPETSYPRGFFYVVGVGGGRPFTSNSCAAQEWDDANFAGNTQPSIYFNTGYAGAYAHDIEPGCTSGYSTSEFGTTNKHQLSVDETAWEIGCSEALYATTVIPTAKPAMYWADVETGNSWSTNKALNRFTIDGISWEMANTGVGGGIYSSPGMWGSITGSQSWGPQTAISANWLSGGLSPCTTANVFGATATQTWLSQHGTTTFDNVAVDEDAACS